MTARKQLCFSYTGYRTQDNTIEKLAQKIQNPECTINYNIR